MRYGVSVWEEGQNGQLWQAGDLWRGCHPGPEGGASLPSGVQWYKSGVKKKWRKEEQRVCKWYPGLSKEQ